MAKHSPFHIGPLIKYFSMMLQGHHGFSKDLAPHLRQNIPDQGHYCVNAIPASHENAESTATTIPRLTNS
jgi:hypothetical protein